MRISPLIGPVVLAIGLVQTAWAAPEPPEGMAYVPGGSFTMGSNQSDRKGANEPLAYNDCRPQHQASTRPFFIDITEVTNAQYKKYCDATRYPVPPHWKDGTFPAGQAAYPVRWVSWHEANAYAQWAGKRLPTEAEWEKAARGTDGRRFPWGNSWNSGNVAFNGQGPEAVGIHPQGASPYGVQDMAGNVAEWTASWFDAYPGSYENIPSFGKQYRVVRGGAYYGFESICLTFFRSVNRPQSRTEWVGFRCAKDAPE